MGINEKLHKLYAKNPSAIDFTAEQLAAKFKCAASTVKKAKAWKAAMLQRKVEKREIAERSFLSWENT